MRLFKDNAPAYTYLWPFLACISLWLCCSQHDRDNIFDPDGTNYTFPDQFGFVLIRAKDSSFTMGNHSNNLQVSFTYNFWIGQTEVTKKQYTTIMDAAYSDFGAPSQWTQPQNVWDAYPASIVNWFNAVLYCNALTKSTGSTDTVYSYSHLMGTPGASCRLDNIKIDLSKTGYRLPTEAEWEYACRAGTTTDQYWGSKSIDNYAWYYYNASYSQPIAHKLPNAFDLYDMNGNLQEWCNDWYGPYSSGPLVDPAGPSTGTERILRGGGFRSSASLTSSSYRRYELPSEYKISYSYSISDFSTYNEIGFRVVRRCTTSVQEQSFNPNTLSRVLVVPGAQLRTGPLPSPSNTATSPLMVMVDTTVSYSAGSQVRLPVEYNDKSGSGISGISFQIEGAESYFDIPVSATSNGTMVLPIGLPSSLGTGTFNMTTIIYDAQGNISNNFETSVRVTGTMGCGVRRISGGEGVTSTLHDMGSNPGVVRIDYETYIVPDRIDVFYNGNWVAGTGLNPGPLGMVPPLADCNSPTEGYVGEKGTFCFTYDPVNQSAGSHLVEVVVSGCVRGGTLWQYDISCTGSDDACLNTAAGDASIWVDPYDSMTLILSLKTDDRGNMFPSYSGDWVAKENEYGCCYGTFLILDLGFHCLRLNLSPVDCQIISEEFGTTPDGMLGIKWYSDSDYEFIPYKIEGNKLYLGSTAYVDNDYFMYGGSDASKIGWECTSPNCGSWF